MARGSRYPRISGSPAAKAQARAAFAVGGVVAKPTNSVLPAITGTAQEGQILTVSNGTWTGSPTSYTYQWKRGGTAISGAVNATRTLTSADVGAVMTCTVTATNAGGPTAATSAGTSAVTAASGSVPVNSVAPAVTGTGTVGQVLTSTTGTWTNSPTSYAYQWRRDGVDITGATSATYTLVTADNGRSITCRVSATNGSGSAGATSNATAVAAVIYAAAFTAGAAPGSITSSGGVGRGTFNSGHSLVAASAPRISYGLTGTASHLVVEPATTNLLQSPNDLTGTGWSGGAQGSKAAPTLVNSTGLSPSGSNAQRYTFPNATASGQQSSRVQLVSGLTVGQTYTVSVWAAGVGGQPDILLQAQEGATPFTGLGSPNVYTRMNPLDGVLTRYSLTFTATQTSAYIILGFNRITGTINVGGTGAGAIDLSFVQLEVGSTATSTLPAGSASATADAISFTVPAGITALAYTFDDATAQAVTVTAGAYSVPTSGLSRSRIRSIYGAADGALSISSVAFGTPVKHNTLYPSRAGDGDVFDMALCPDGAARGWADDSSAFSGGTGQPTLSSNAAVVSLQGYSTALPKFRAAVAAGRAVVSMIGDSTQIGVGSGTAAVGSWRIEDADTLNPAAYLAAALTAGGFNAVTNCFAGGDRNLTGLSAAQYGQFYSPDASFATGWAFSAALTPWGARLALASSGTAASAWTPSGSYDRVEIIAPTYPGNGTINVAAGGANVNVSEDAASGVSRQTLTCTLGTGAVSFSRVSGSCFSPAMRAWNSATPNLVQVETLGVSSWQTSDWVVATEGFSPLRAIDSNGTHLFVINLGLNDKFFGRSVAAFKADLKTIISRCLAANADVLLTVPTPANTSDAHNLDGTWIAAIYEAAAETGVLPPVDLYALFGSYAASAGDYFDGTHLKASGSQRSGTAEAQPLINAMPAVTIKRVNAMAALGSAGASFAAAGTVQSGSTWKGNGMTCVAGVLYGWLSIHHNAGLRSSTYGYKQRAQKAQLVKSADLGLTWSPLPPAASGGTVYEYASPMFTGSRFGAPFFIHFGPNDVWSGPFGSDDYVYCPSTDFLQASDSTRWSTWNDGDGLIMGRCLKSKVGDQSAADWSFFLGGDGMQSSAWGLLADAVQILTDAGHVSMNGMWYLPATQEFVYLGWWYATPGTFTDSYTQEWRSRTPWGPWRKVGAAKRHNSAGDLGLYNPAFIPQTLLADGGLNAKLLATGVFDNQDLQTGDYQPHIIPWTAVAA